FTYTSLLPEFDYTSFFSENTVPSLVWEWKGTVTTPTKLDLETRPRRMYSLIPSFRAVQCVLNTDCDFTRSRFPFERCMDIPVEVKVLKYKSGSVRSTGGRISASRPTQKWTAGGR